jgi:hypothetical protein
VSDDLFVFTASVTLALKPGLVVMDPESGAIVRP